jgi:hypothetical protein
MIGCNGATLSRFECMENGVQVTDSMIIIAVVAASVAISAFLMQRNEGLRALEPPLALTIASFVEQDTAKGISPGSAVHVQLRPSAANSHLFLTVNGIPLRTTDVALNEGLSLVSTTLDGEEQDSS